MTDPVWYYARGDVEKGPLTTAQMKALAAAGKIRPEDLVWKEGMETWVPASEAAELFPGGMLKTDEPAKPAEAAEGRSLSEPIAVQNRTATAALRWPADRRRIAQLAALLGFCTALLSRGCDELSDRYVARLQANATLAEQRHHADWGRRQRQLTERLQALEAAPRTPADPNQVRELRDQLADLMVQREREEQHLRDTQWSAMKSTAALAEAERDQAAYWRGMALLAATFVLAGGLLGLASTSEGTERWMSLAAMLVLLYAIYSGTAFA